MQKPTFSAILLKRGREFLGPFVAVVYMAVVYMVFYGRRNVNNTKLRQQVI